MRKSAWFCTGVPLHLIELSTFMRPKNIVTQGNGRVTKHGMEVDELYV